jgi:membrane-bound ClpP family serine protease
MEIYWGVGLFALAILIMVIEVFVPSGGLLAIVSAVSAIGGCVAFFRHSTEAGLLSALFLLVAVPIAIWVTIKYYPHTPIGRRMFLGSPPGEDSPEAQKHVAERLEAEQQAQQIIGAQGTAVTDLHPVGVVKIEGQRLQALAETGIIEANTPVEVIAVVGTEVRVRPIG